MNRHARLTALGESMTRPTANERGRASWTGGNISQALLGEVLSRVAVNTPPVTSRAAIANGEMLRTKLPLAEGSVSKAVNSLITHQLLVEDFGVPLHEEELIANQGRRRIPVRLNNRSWFSIGVYINQLDHTKALLTAVATPIDDSELLIDQPLVEECRTTDDGLVTAITKLVGRILSMPAVEALQHKKTGWLPWLGLGVAVGNPVFEGSILKWNMGKLESSELSRHLVDALNIPVVVENDASVLAVRQLYGKEAADGDFALILVTEDGVGAAFAVAGRVYRGSRGMAGEIGHLKVCPTSAGSIETDSDGQLSFGGICSCGGGRGKHVEVFATPVRLKDALRQLGVPEALTAPNALADAPPEIQNEAKKLFAIAGQALGQGVTSLANVVNPDQMYFVLPESLEVDDGATDATSVIKREYRTALDAELHDSFSRSKSDFKHNRYHYWDSNELAQRIARAAATRVIIEFIEHLSGLDGCPTSLSPRTSSRDVVLPFAGGFLASVVGGAIGTAFGTLYPTQATTLEDVRQLLVDEPRPSGERLGDAADLALAPWNQPAEQATRVPTRG